jgi:hypothetical protein
MMGHILLGRRSWNMQEDGEDGVRFTFEEEDDGALCIGDRDSHKKTK